MLWPCLFTLSIHIQTARCACIQCMHAVALPVRTLPAQSLRPAGEAERLAEALDCRHAGCMPQQSATSAGAAASRHKACMQVRAAVNLHNSLLDRILRLPASFFDTNPSGRIMNRFSRDTEIMDSVLPMSLAQVRTHSPSTCMRSSLRVGSPLCMCPPVMRVPRLRTPWWSVHVRAHAWGPWMASVWLSPPSAPLLAPWSAQPRPPRSCL
jgi:ABC transporter transmembrane region